MFSFFFHVNLKKDRGMLLNPGHDLMLCLWSFNQVIKKTLQKVVFFFLIFLVFKRNFQLCVCKIEINLLDGLRMTKKYQFWKMKEKKIHCLSGPKFKYKALFCIHTVALHQSVCCLCYYVLTLNEHQFSTIFKLYSKGNPRDFPHLIHGLKDFGNLI